MKFLIYKLLILADSDIYWLKKWKFCHHFQSLTKTPLITNHLRRNQTSQYGNTFESLSTAIISYPQTSIFSPKPPFSPTTPINLKFLKKKISISINFQTQKIFRSVAHQETSKIEIQKISQPFKAILNSS